MAENTEPFATREDCWEELIKIAEDPSWQKRGVSYKTSWGEVVIDELSDFGKDEAQEKELLTLLPKNRLPDEKFQREAIKRLHAKIIKGLPESEKESLAETRIRVKALYNVRAGNLPEELFVGHVNANLQRLRTVTAAEEIKPGQMAEAISAFQGVTQKQEPLAAPVPAAEAAGEPYRPQPPAISGRAESAAPIHFVPSGPGIVYGGRKKPEEKGRRNGGGVLPSPTTPAKPTSGRWRPPEELEPIRGMRKVASSQIAGLANAIGLGKVLSLFGVYQSPPESEIIDGEFRILAQAPEISDRPPVLFPPLVEAGLISPKRAMVVQGASSSRLPAVISDEEIEDFVDAEYREIFALPAKTKTTQDAEKTLRARIGKVAKAVEKRKEEVRADLVKFRGQLTEARERFSQLTKPQQEAVKAAARNLREASADSQRIVEEYREAGKQYDPGAEAFVRQTKQWLKLASQDPVYFTLYSAGMGILEGLPGGEALGKLEDKYWSLKTGQAHSLWFAPPKRVADWKAKKLIEAFAGQTLGEALNQFLVGTGIKKEVVVGRDRQGREIKRPVWTPVHRLVSASDFLLAKVQTAVETKPNTTKNFLGKVLLGPQGLRKKLRKAEEKDPISALLYLIVSTLFHFTVGIITRFIGVVAEEFLEKTKIGQRIKSFFGKIADNRFVKTAKSGGALVKDFLGGYWSLNTAAGAFIALFLTRSLPLGLLGGFLGGSWQGILNLSRDPVRMKWVKGVREEEASLRNKVGRLQKLETDLNKRLAGKTNFTNGVQTDLTPRNRPWRKAMGIKGPNFELIREWRTLTKEIATAKGTLVKSGVAWKRTGVAERVAAMRGSLGLKVSNFLTGPGPLSRFAAFVKQHLWTKGLVPLKGIALGILLWDILPAFDLPSQLALAAIPAQMIWSTREWWLKKIIPSSVNKLFARTPWKGGAIGAVLGLLVTQVLGLPPVVGIVAGAGLGMGLQYVLNLLSGPAGKVMQVVGRVGGGVLNVGFYLGSFGWMKEMGGLSGLLSQGTNLATGGNLLQYGLFRLGPAGAIGGTVATGVVAIATALGAAISLPIWVIGAIGAGVAIVTTVAIDVFDTDHKIYNNLLLPAYNNLLLPFFNNFIQPWLGPLLEGLAKFIGPAAVSMAGMVLGILGFLMSFFQALSAKKIEDMAAALVMAAVSLAMVGALFVQILEITAFANPFAKSELLGQLFLSGTTKTEPPGGAYDEKNRTLTFVYTVFFPGAMVRTEEGGWKPINSPLQEISLVDKFIGGVKRNDFNGEPRLIEQDPPNKIKTTDVSWAPTLLPAAENAVAIFTMLSSKMELGRGQKLTFRITYYLTDTLEKILNNHREAYLCDEFFVVGAYLYPKNPEDPPDKQKFERQTINNAKLARTICLNGKGEAVKEVTAPRKAIDCAAEFGLPPEPLREVFVDAGKTFNVPPAVLAAIAKVEDSDIFNHDYRPDRSGQNRLLMPYQVTMFGAVFGKDYHLCAPNACSARGPMQFTTGGTNKQAGSDSMCWPDKPEETQLPNAWKTYGCAITEVSSGKFTNRYPSCNSDDPDSGPHVCNIVDAIFAAGEKLNNDAGKPTTQNWTDDQIKRAVIGYYGSQFTPREGYPDYYQCVADYNRAHPDLIK